MTADPRSFLVPLFTTLVGCALFYALGQQVHIAYGTHLVRVEIAFAILGVVIGYFLGAGLAPKVKQA